MNPEEIMNALQSKLDAQASAFNRLLQSSLETHSDSIHDTLQRHLQEVDLKVAKIPIESSRQVTDHASRLLKLNVPRFDGTNAIDWIFQIEAFFDFHATPPVSRLQIVSFHLDGRAAS
jgi:hypothetical protein